MDRSQKSFSKFDATMRDSGACSFELVLSASRGFIRRHIFHESDRRRVHEVAVLWESKDGRVPEKSRICGQPQTSSEAHAHPGDRGDLPRPQHQPAALSACSVSVSSSGFCGRKAESGLGDGYHLYSFRQRFCISGCDYGLVLPLCHFLAIVEQLGDVLLRGGARRSLGTSEARHLQYRPRLPVHERRFHREIGAVQGQDQHGFPWPGFRQHFCGKAMEDRKVRGYLPQRLSDNVRRSRWAQELLSILQQRSVSPIAGIPDASGSLLPRTTRRKMRLKLSTGQKVLKWEF